ncbi:MAG: RNase adapter RapZ [Candidatus Aminicenantes bacterium]|nr:RNase adapter RapZ [Candidatus Aminicenantes bacterium]
MTRRNDGFLIITGLSGSGKTVASRFLEDLGFFCVDNLPAKLIPSLVDLRRRKTDVLDRVALVMDMREPGFLTDFPKEWANIRKIPGARLLFFDASDEAIVHRFSESRRPHPLARGRSVPDAVRLERKRLAPINELADEVINTSEMTTAHLRDVLARRFLRTDHRPLQIRIVSFGYKHGIPLDADLVFDARFLPNPFYDDDLREKPGTHPRVRDFVLRRPETKAFLAELARFMNFLLPRFEAEGKSQLVVGVGCTGGRHRSVVVAGALGDVLRGRKYDIKIFHRDISK